MENKHNIFAILATVICIISYFITLLPTVIIVPDLGSRVNVFYLIMAAIIYICIIIIVIVGLNHADWRYKWAMKLMATNSDEIKYAPSRTLMLLNCIGIIILGVIASVFNVIPLFNYLP